MVKRRYPRSIIDQIYENMVERIKSSDCCDDRFSSKLEKAILENELTDKERMIDLMSFPLGDVE